MKVLLIVLCIIGYLLCGFATYFVGIGTEVLGCRKRREYMPWRDRPNYIYGKHEMHFPPRREIESLVHLPMPFKVLQFIFWPISLWYCVIVTLIRIAEFSLDVYKEKLQEKKEREIEEALRETDEYEDKDEVDNENEKPDTDIYLISKDAFDNDTDHLKVSLTWYLDYDVIRDNDSGEEFEKDAVLFGDCLDEAKYDCTAGAIYIRNDITYCDFEIETV